MEISFYHLTVQSLDIALPKLLSKVRLANMKVLVKVKSTEDMNNLDLLLWTFDAESFLVHDTLKSKYQKDQPIYITTGDENPAFADVLILTDGTTSTSMDGYKRVLEIFDGTNSLAVDAARERWSKYKNDGHNISYFQQSETGGWVKKG
ncbi:MAG: DNA polymerase III subunit chi [Emcibacteraceae bacterium]|jgi:DNA polymerase III subunit chi|nr:DNA polymerase III subunit chi [Emcibacteraceae bacterium]